MTRGLLFAAALCIFTSAVCRAHIYYKNCEGLADHPSVVTGNFHNLCVKDHVFKEQKLSWLITKTDVMNTEFDSCVFQNSLSGLTNFSDSVFSKVKFNDCKFGSFIRNPMRLENVQLNNVEFNDCVFDKSAKLIFTEFGMNNVTFNRCRFESDSTFSKGQMQDVTFNGCSFKRSPEAGTVSGKDAVRFNALTMRYTGFVKSEFINPIIFEWVNGADLFFNHTSFGQYWCHNRPLEGQQPKYFSRFNDSVFQDTTFRENVMCDQTSWNGFTMLNGTFLSNADFSASEIQDLGWDTVFMSSNFKGQCNELDFKGSKIFRRYFWNVTVDCKLDFSKAQIEIVNFQTLKAKESNFQGAVFRNQEFVDNQCCMKVCGPKECQCDVQSISACPSSGYPVDYNAAWFCFPADARVAVAGGGSVRMDELRHGHSVAVGGGAHSDVYFFGHRTRWALAPFVEVAHAGPESPLRVSAEHYVHANGRLVTAGALKVGDTLRAADGAPRTVTAVSRVMRHGLYAPASLHGDLIVDGVTVSSYTAAVHPRLAHALLRPLRVLHRAGLGGLVARFNAFETRSWEHIPRALGIPVGPREVEL